MLWADLHALLADQLAWRARGGALRADRSSTPRRGVLVDFIEALHGRARLRWPEPERLEELAGARLRPAHAYAWLATRAGLTTAELDAELFGPDGYIARRPED